MADLTRKTANLFDGTLLGGYYSDENFNLRGDEAVYKSIKVYLTAGTYTFSWGKNVSIARYIIDDEYNQGGLVDTQSYTFTSTTDGYVGVSFRDATSSSTVWDVTTPIMLNSGSIALPYEPYGWVHSLRKFESKSETIQSGDTIYADGTAISTYTIKGNTTQSGTPTPSNPVSVNGVGNKTANLLNPEGNWRDYNCSHSVDGGDITVTGKWFSYVAFTAKPNTTYSIKYRNVLNQHIAIYKNSVSGSPLNTTYTDFVKFTTDSDTQLYIVFYANSGGDERTVVYRDVRLYEGDYTSATIPNYEPYGYYKIPISTAQTTPIYLSQSLYKIDNYPDDVNSSGTATYKITMQRITQISLSNNFSRAFTVDIPVPAAIQTIYSNIAVSTSSLPDTADRDGKVFINSSKTFIGFGASEDFPIAGSGNPTQAERDAFQAYLQNNEVYVWYVLATPTTESVTTPSIPTTDGANTITIDTTVQPSEFSATWTGWHDSLVKEYDGSDWQ